MKRFFYFLTGCFCAGVLIWQFFRQDASNWYLPAVLLLLLSILPFLLAYERKKPSARELALLSALIALAVAGRAAFYLIPQVKPIAAVVLVAGVCLGPARGYLVGVFAAFLSNFIFGQGIWTPFQMVGLGLVGLLSGWLLQPARASGWKMALCGFFLAAFIYGFIVDTGSVLLAVSVFSWQAVLAVYAAGLPFDLAFGASTAVFLFLFGMPFLHKLQRLNTKFAIVPPRLDKCPRSCYGRKK